MSTDSVYSQVAEIISESLGVDASEVTPKANLIDDLDVDSLGLVELVMELESAFDLEIPDEEAAEIKSVQDAVDYITAQIS